MCQWPAFSNQTYLLAARFQGDPRTAAKSDASGKADTIDLNRAPLRIIRDPYPTFSAVAVDPGKNEIILQDENLNVINIYDRLANTPPGSRMTEPKRSIGGSNTELSMNCGLYVDPQNGDIYSIPNDVKDTLVVFPHDANGNVAPKRKLRVPHTVFGIAVNEETQELFLAVEHPPAIVVFPKMAQGNDPALRILEGAHTQLAGALGITVDPKNKVMFVSNHGAVASNKDGKAWSRWPVSVSGRKDPMWDIPGGRRSFKLVDRGNEIPGSGRFEPPSITSYPIDANGDIPPLRVIKGPRTQLNWPEHIYFDVGHQELFVANDGDDSVLVFRATDNGEVAPLRVLKGPSTGLKSPTDVFVDTKNDELVVANMGNHASTVYRRTATGDSAPLRTIRAAPLGTQALVLGHPGAVGYDSKRDEILVPN
jgi:6-phosphogluconolactonase (cycloisomerase 2 family)